MPVIIDMGGTTAVVTGGGSGIGRRTALMLAESGAAVAVADIDGDAARAVAEEAALSGVDVAAIEVDVADWRSCQNAAASAEELGPVGVLVNGAAVWTRGEFAATDPSDWTGDIEVGLRGTMLFTRAILPAMVERGRGSVINVGSDVGRVGAAGYVAYSSAKAGVMGFTKALAREVAGHGIRVNCVSPGTVRTPGSADSIAAVTEERLIDMFPLGRIGEPLDIASAVLFFASDLAAWITGQILSVSGGATMGG